MLLEEGASAFLDGRGSVSAIVRVVVARQGRRLSFHLFGERTLIALCGSVLSDRLKYF